MPSSSHSVSRAASCRPTISLQRPWYSICCSETVCLLFRPKRPNMFPSSPPSFAAAPARRLRRSIRFQRVSGRISASVAPSLSSICRACSIDRRRRSAAVPAMVPEAGMIMFLPRFALTLASFARFSASSSSSFVPSFIAALM